MPQGSNCTTTSFARVLIRFDSEEDRYTVSLGVEALLLSFVALSVRLTPDFMSVKRLLPGHSQRGIPVIPGSALYFDRPCFIDGVCSASVPVTQLFFFFFYFYGANG